MNESLVEEHFEKWKYSIGSLIIGFGEIELASYNLWVYYNLPIEDAPKEFQPRNNKVIGMIGRDKSIDLETKQKLKALLIEANVLAKKRNDIAHNPVQVNLYKHAETGELLESAEINHLLNGGVIDYIELSEILRKVELLGKELYEIIPLPLMYPEGKSI